MTFPWFLFWFFLSREDCCYIWTLFAYREQISLMLPEISQEIFQMTSQIVRSYFKVSFWKSFDQTFYSDGKKRFSVCLLAFAKLRDLLSVMESGVEKMPKILFSVTKSSCQQVFKHCVRVCVCLFPSTVEASPDWNKTNVMPEIRPAMLCWGNYFLSSTFITTS